MKSWKAVLGLGAACAACCAIPVLGLAGGLATFGSALVACADEFAPVAVLLLAGVLAAAGAWWWRRRKALHGARCDCSNSCSTKIADARN